MGMSSTVACAPASAANHHLIVGGQRSGKSGHAELLAQAWEARCPDHRVVVVATAQVGDNEMQARIDRHRQDRPASFATVEAPMQLASVLNAHSSPHTLLLVDCLTLWLTNWWMPASGGVDLDAWRHERAAVLHALPLLPGPVVCVSNEVGWGVVPVGREVRGFVDELGRLNQDVARRCRCLTLMVAGQAWTREVVA